MPTVRKRTSSSLPKRCILIRKDPSLRPKAVRSGAQLLPERKDGIHSVGADRWRWEPFVEQGVQCVGSRSETSQRQCGATRSRVVTAKIAGHVADPGHIVARASRGEHGCGETPAHCGRVEEDRKFGTATRNLVTLSIKASSHPNLGWFALEICELFSARRDAGILRVREPRDRPHPIVL